MVLWHRLDQRSVHELFASRNLVAVAPLGCYQPRRLTHGYVAVLAPSTTIIGIRLGLSDLWPRVA